ncbi:hypothetical protein M9458_037565, partial [Cirrhinus mrigala]
HAELTLPSFTPPSPVGIPLPTALPVIAIAILSVWAAHCIPEASSVHESVHESAPEASPVHESAPEALSVHESAPEASSVHESVHKTAPEITSVHKSAPETTSDLKSAPELPSGLKSAPEDPSGLKSAPEDSSGLKSAPEVPSGPKSAPEAFPVGEATPMPPEVSAPAVEPLMEGALPFKFSASPFILSASSVPVLPRSQFMMRAPVLPWRAPAPPAMPQPPPWRAPAPPAPPPAPPWRAPASPALPPSPPWKAPVPPALPLAPPWRAPAPPALPWKASSLPILPQSPGPPTAPQDCFAVGASGSRSLGGGLCYNHQLEALQPGLCALNPPCFTLVSMCLVLIGSPVPCVPFLLVCFVILALVLCLIPDRFLLFCLPATCPDLLLEL